MDDLDTYAIKVAEALEAYAHKVKIAGPVHGAPEFHRSMLKMAHSLKQKKAAYLEKTAIWPAVPALMGAVPGLAAGLAGTKALVGGGSAAALGLGGVLGGLGGAGAMHAVKNPLGRAFKGMGKVFSGPTAQEGAETALNKLFLSGSKGGTGQAATDAGQAAVAKYLKGHAGAQAMIAEEAAKLAPAAATAATNASTNALSNWQRGTGLVGGGLLGGMLLNRMMSNRGSSNNAPAIYKI